MSTIPDELRDRVVRKLEASLEQRDRDLGRVERDAAAMQTMVAELEADLERVQGLSDALRVELAAAAARSQHERQAAAARLEAMQYRLESQRRAILSRIEEVREAHRREWGQLEEEISGLREQREERRRQQFEAAARAFASAQKTLDGLDRDTLDLLDLTADLLASRARVDEGQALTVQRGDPGEALAAALGAEEASRLLHSRARARDETLAHMRDNYREDSTWLDRLLEGAPLEVGETHLPDQAETVAALLSRERPVLAALIEEHVRRPAQDLRRWNGHRSAAHRIEAIRDVVASEIVRARVALPDAERHEERRYSLDWLLNELRMRFGAIDVEAERTAGQWQDDGDRKSPYSYFLGSSVGELTVTVPWTGPVTVMHGGRERLRVTVPAAVTTHVRHIGELAARWKKLKERIASPTWSPEMGSEVTH